MGGTRPPMPPPEPPLGNRKEEGLTTDEEELFPITALLLLEEPFGILGAVAGFVLHC